MKSYAELKKAIKHVLNQTSNAADFKTGFSPAKRESLLASRAVKRLNPNASDNEIVDMLYKHPSPTAMALIKNNTSSAPLAEKINYQLSNVNTSEANYDSNKLSIPRPAGWRQPPTPLAERDTYWQPNNYHSQS